MLRVILLVLTALAMSIGASSSAWAQETNVAVGAVARAEQLFNEATALEEAGNWEAACPKLEESHRLDPAVGTQFNLAVCYEKIGRLGSAWRTYDAVKRLAHQTGKASREEASQNKMNELRERVGWVKIQSATAAPPVVNVSIDGVRIAHEDWESYPVDAGEHRIEATAPTKKSWARKLTTTDATTTTIDVPPLESSHEVVTVTREGGSTRRTAGFAMLGVGALGVGAAIVTGVMLLNAKDTADDRCVPYCSDSTGRDAVSRGRLLLPINVIAWGLAAVGIGVGTYLLLTAPPRARSFAAGSF
jgi:hypothetical protein